MFEHGRLEGDRLWRLAISLAISTVTHCGKLDAHPLGETAEKGQLC